MLQIEKYLTYLKSDLILFYHILSDYPSVFKLIQKDYNSINIIMEKSKQQVKLKQKYISHIKGPILFTAPHSKKLFRGGEAYGQDRRIHLRQLYTSMLAVEFALKSSKMVGLQNSTNSFCIWGKAIQIDEEDLDPNYLLQQQYVKSPFHQSLHKFQMLNKAKPIFHVDIHGKYDRKNNCELDIGMACLLAFWKQPEFVKQLQTYFTTQFNLLFKGMKLGNFQPKCNCSPYLNGLWGGTDSRGVATMTQQAVVLGIPSIQLQIPAKMRDALAKNEKFRDGFLKILIDGYKKIIINWYPKKIYPNIFDETLGVLLNDNKYEKKNIEQLLVQLKQMQQKAKLNLNAKII